MKRNAVAAIMLLLVLFAFSACASVTPDGQTAKDSGIAGSDASTDHPDDGYASAPEFFNDMGKTLGELKKEHPDGELLVRPDGFPDHAAACFGTPETEYLFCFFGTQSGDAEKAMNECENQLTCAGFLTTAGFLFPDMEDEMSFDNFFSLLGVDDYTYFGEDEDTITAEGWLSFSYRGMDVMVNTNEAAPAGGWNFTGAESVKRTAPVSIVNAEIFHSNQDLADAVMFDETVS